MKGAISITALALLAGAPTLALAAALSVMPTRIEVPPRQQHTTMTVRSDGAASSVVQLRIFKWKEGASASRLSATNAVAISPPMVRLGARQELTVRIVRTSGRPVRGRECYRVLVDRLPDADSSVGGVTLRMRHSVPVCFQG